MRTQLGLALPQQRQEARSVDGRLRQPAAEYGRRAHARMQALRERKHVCLAWSPSSYGGENMMTTAVYSWHADLAAIVTLK